MKVCDGRAPFGAAFGHRARPFGAPFAGGMAVPPYAARRMVTFVHAPRLMMVRAAGLEPAWPCGRRIFLPLRLSPPPWSVTGVRGLDYTFTISQEWGLGAARLVSTPSGAAASLARDRHVKGFPDFEQFYALGFPKGTQIGSSLIQQDL